MREVARSGSVFDRIRAACAEVARRARHVRLDAERLVPLARALAAGPAPEAGPDPAHHHRGDDASTLAYVLTLDAINFGSGWFPHLRKRPGMSGYFTIATSLAERFDAAGPWSAEDLLRIGAEECAQVFGQDLGAPDVAELMQLFAAALRDLGRFLLDEHGGRFEGPVEAAGGSAGALVAILARMPLYRDVARYEELEVPFYKRAQLTAADLSLAFGGRGPGRFGGLDALTLFADNLVPHVLRYEGVLRYAPALARRIEAGELLAPASPEEVEIRAVAVHAVERLAEVTREGGAPLGAWQLDHRLWGRGQRPELKARPRHRTRTPFY